MKQTLAVAALFALAGAPALAQPAPAPAPPTTLSSLLLSKDLIPGPNKEVRIISLTSPPGGASAVHRHNGQVFVIVTEGAMIMQVKGQAPVTVGPGQVFYESPDDVHETSRNASKTEPAKFIAVMILEKGAPQSVPAQ